jgi:primosomal replication protein N
MKFDEESKKMDEMTKNNRVTIAGRIATVSEYSHEVFGEKFYKMNVEVERTSGSTDVIPVIVSERFGILGPLGKFVQISGQYRSHNVHTEDGNRLELNVFASEIEIPERYIDKNKIELDGFICKPPTYRKTPLGREIADLMLAVNRQYGKSDYIPCILWGRNARFVSGLDIGSRLKIEGRIQSREYTKQISETESEIRVAYEVSAFAAVMKEGV